MPYVPGKATAATIVRKGELSAALLKKLKDASHEQTLASVTSTRDTQLMDNF